MIVQPFIQRPKKNSKQHVKEKRRLPFIHSFIYGTIIVVKMEKPISISKKKEINWKNKQIENKIKNIP